MQVCEHCGRDYDPIYAGQRYCDDGCSWVATGKTLTQDRQDRE